MVLNQRGFAGSMRPQDGNNVRRLEVPGKPEFCFSGGICHNTLTISTLLPNNSKVILEKLGDSLD